MCESAVTMTTQYKLPTMLLDKHPSRPRRSSSESLPFHFDDERLTDTTPSRTSQSTDLSLASLGTNASVPYSALATNAAVRPLEFPAPTVERAVTHSSYVKDHRSGNVFYATSVLMRRSIHTKTCTNCNNRPRVSNSSLNKQKQHARANSRDQARSWHSHTSNQYMEEPCEPGCNLPTYAYCVRRKLCDTIYGSVRLCVVLKRLSRIHNTQQFNATGSTEAVWETTDQMVAIKVVNWYKLQQLRGRHLEDPIKELAAVQLLGDYHPHVIPLVDAIQDDTHLFQIYPFMKGGDLYGRLVEEMHCSITGRIDEQLAREWLRQILSALSHFQKKGVCHRDLCMENILVDDYNNIRIIDFGLCLRVPYVDPNNRNLVTDASSNTVRRLIKAQGQGGKWEYMSPEVATRQECFDGFAIDLWAVGIVLFECLVGKKPFALPDASDTNFHTIAMQGNLAGLLRMNGISLDEEACDLLQKMLISDPSKRLTLAEVVSHPWVNRGRDDMTPSRLQSPIEQGHSSWFLHNEAIDENDDADPSKYELAHRLRFSSCPSGDDVTADSTDEETRNTRVSPHSVSYNISNKQPSMVVGTAEQDIKGTSSNSLDHKVLERINTANEKKSFLSYVKNPKKLWKSRTKKTSTMTTIASDMSFCDRDNAFPKIDVQKDDRMC